MWLLLQVVGMLQRCGRAHGDIKVLNFMKDTPSDPVQMLDLQAMPLLDTGVAPTPSCRH